MTEQILAEQIVGWLFLIAVFVFLLFVNVAGAKDEARGRRR